MWIPRHYKVQDPRIIREFIRQTGLATLITGTGARPIATHTPMELEREMDGRQVLRGHIAKANPQSGILHEAPEVLAIFQSPVHHYISSSWYGKPSPPTWDYMSVHVYGRAKVITGEALWQSVKRLVDRHEQISERPVSLETMPDKVQGMLKGVTGFEILVDRYEAAFKLSQNKSDADFQSIIGELEKLNTPLAALMAEELSNRKQQTD